MKTNTLIVILIVLLLANFFYTYILIGNKNQYQFILDEQTVELDSLRQVIKNKIAQEEERIKHAERMYNETKRAVDSLKTVSKK
jgi:hypothetical protein